MRIYVKATPRSSRNEVVKISEEEYKVRVTAPPERGKANVAVIELLSKYFRVPKSVVNIVAGKTAKTKIIDIYEKSPNKIL
ncbi:MAG: hypothetical protein A3J76_03735 [Candidatus Moranbacteria bacterium RBG_13_45_13]|nr:MAG: hypothetical protein A3J76_03735 [Candidatus Moranbacteria bacterium RBG_13_45_13]